MPNRFYRVAASAVALTILFVMGCSGKSKELTAQTPDHADQPREFENAFVYMMDNAMLEDASIADFHFEPHVAALSGIGVKRVARMGELLSTCGGTIHYETASVNEELIAARLEAVREFLATSGVDTTLVKVEAGSAQSSHLSAREAIEIKAAGVGNGGNEEDAAGNAQPSAGGRS